jgi:hypothetical protein
MYMKPATQLQNGKYLGPQHLGNMHCLESLEFPSTNAVASFLVRILTARKLT